MESSRDSAHAAAFPRPGERRGPAGACPRAHPQFRRLMPPLIVIGMHRSGTSLVAGMLATLGVYMGPGIRIPGRGSGPEAFAAGYAESEEFVRVNDRLLALAGARWDRIDPFLSRRGDPSLAAAGERLIARATAGSLRRYLACSPRGWTGPWGWKDPRNSLTLPLWLRLFPNASVLHVRRDPDMAAASLHRRAQEWAAAPPGPPLPLAERARWWLKNPGEAVLRAAWRAGLLPRSVPTADPCLHMDYCRHLALQYVRACRDCRHQAARYMEVRYEEIAADPRGAAAALARFAGAAAMDEALTRAATLVLSARERSAAAPPEAVPAPAASLPATRRTSAALPASNR